MNSFPRVNRNENKIRISISTDWHGRHPSSCLTRVKTEEDEEVP